MGWTVVCVCVCDNSVPYLTEGITVGSEPTPAPPQEGVCIEVRFFIISLNLLSFSGHGRTPSGLRSTFTPACGFRCTRLVRLHQSLVNLHRSPAVEGEQHQFRWGMRTKNLLIQDTVTGHGPQRPGRVGKIYTDHSGWNRSLNIHQ